MASAKKDGAETSENSRKRRSGSSTDAPVASKRSQTMHPAEADKDVEEQRNVERSRKNDSERNKTGDTNEAERSADINCVQQVDTPFAAMVRSFYDLFRSCMAKGDHGAASQCIEIIKALPVTDDNDVLVKNTFINLMKQSQEGDLTDEVSQSDSKSSSITLFGDQGGGKGSQYSVLPGGVEGGFSFVRFGEVLSSKESVAFKICEQEDFMLELGFLQQLAYNNCKCVSQVMDILTVQEKPVLVMPRYGEIDFWSVASSEEPCVLFVGAACSILDEIHSCNIAHGDIKPDAFMWDGRNNQYVLTDFNASCCADYRFSSGRFSGTPGWVYVDSPIHCGRDGDLIALASLFGWMIGIRGCGDSASDFQHVQLCVRLYLKESNPEKWKRKIHRLVTSLLEKSVGSSLKTAWNMALSDCDTQDEEDTGMSGSSSVVQKARSDDCRDSFAFEGNWGVGAC